MNSRVTFPNKLLPYLLVAPQIAITLVFFFWPASQAIYQSLFREDPFGLRSTFVGLGNFRQVLADPNYVNSLKVTFVFCISTAAVAMITALVLAVMADRVVRGRGLYRTLLIWPYAVAPAVADDSAAIGDRSGAPRVTTAAYGGAPRRPKRRQRR